MEEIPTQQEPIESLPSPERPGDQVFDTMIVFGQGPVKPVLIERELTQQQHDTWDSFVQDPLHQTEPDFRVVTGKDIADIEAREDLTEVEKSELIKTKRDELQHTGRLALNRWGRQNALAAGVLLMAGDTKELLLSGGKTIPTWAKESLPNEVLENWPSEAQLMKQIIVSRFADEYLQKYGQSIDGAITCEDSSTNTLENLAQSLNTTAKLTQPDTSVGLLATDFHIQRSALITKMFSIPPKEGAEHGAQTVLNERTTSLAENSAGRTIYERILKHLDDSENNADLQQRIVNEEQWTSGLIQPEYLAYWLGYFGMVDDPTIIQNTIELLQNEDWINDARAEFNKVGLDFDSFSGRDLQKLQIEKPQMYEQLRTQLVTHKQQHRVMPPPPRTDITG